LFKVKYHAGTLGGWLIFMNTKTVEEAVDGN
jgi:hypothetical protein